MLERCLSLFERFGGRRLLTGGNHDLWCPGGDSLKRWREELASVARACGFAYLDEAPVVLDGLGVVGSVGWYDYSFADGELGLPREFYEAKLGPGLALRMGCESPLARLAADLPEHLRRITARWMDGVYVRLPMSDEAFTRELVERLRGHVEAVAPRCERIVACLHHLPFAEMVLRKSDPNWNFANAFMGSERFGEVLLACPKVAYVFVGHSHARQVLRKEHIVCVNVGCTYGMKRYDVLEMGPEGDRLNGEPIEAVVAAAGGASASRREEREGGEDRRRG